jgi:hypothetical protein
LSYRRVSTSTCAKTGATVIAKANNPEHMIAPA